MSNTLTGLIPTIYTALDIVSREQVGFIPAVARNTKADAAAKGQTVTAPVAPAATTVDITPGATAPNDGDQTIGTVDVKITKSKWLRSNGMVKNNWHLARLVLTTPSSPTSSPGIPRTV
jgi:hypothetical protein